MPTYIRKLVSVICLGFLLSQIVPAGMARAANSLTIALDQTLVTGPIPAGAPTYIFAAFKLTAGDTAVTITSLKVVSDSAAKGEFRNIGIYKDGSQFVGSMVPTLANGSATYTFSPAITIAAGATTLLETSASITEQANGNMRLGLDGFQFSGTAPAVNQGLPFYGNNVPVSGGSSTGTESITATTTPAACGTTNATVTINVQGISGTAYTVKKGTANIATFTGSGTTSDTVAVGSTNTYALFKGSAQVGTNQTVTGTQQSGCGGGTNANLTVTVTPAACTATMALVTITVQGVNTVTYIVQRNGSNYVTFIGNGSVNDTVAIGSTNTYTLWTNGNQSGAGQSVTGVKQSSCGGGSPVTGTLTATTAPAACTATTAAVAVSVQGTSGVAYVVKKNNADFATFTGSGSTNDTVAIGTTNTYTLFSGGTQIGTAQSVTGAKQAGCSSGSTLAITTESLPDGTVGQRYSTTLLATGGTAPYTWSLQSGQFNTYPCCYTTISANGVFASQDSATSIMPFSGAYQLPVKVTDAVGATQTKTLTFTVKPASTTTTPINEGYLDVLNSGIVAGWAYKTKTDGTLVQINIVFENVSNTSTTYSLTLSPSVVRSDVAGYLQNRYGVSVGTTPTGFNGSPASVITAAGTYRIRSATFDGTPLVLSDQAKQAFTVGQATTGPTGKYVKVDGDPTVYWVTLWGGKMPILSAQVFQSYGGRWEDVVTITQEALDAYDDVDYIRLQGNARVYKISNGVKQYLTPAAAARLNVDPAKVVVVNTTEFYTYKTGKTIQ